MLLAKPGEDCGRTEWVKRDSYGLTSPDLLEVVGERMLRYARVARKFGLEVAERYEDLADLKGSIGWVVEAGETDEYWLEKDRKRHALLGEFPLIGEVAQGLAETIERYDMADMKRDLRAIAQAMKVMVVQRDGKWIDDSKAPPPPPPTAAKIAERIKFYEDAQAEKVPTWNVSAVCLTSDYLRNSSYMSPIEAADAHAAALNLVADGRTANVIASETKHGCDMITIEVAETPGLSSNAGTWIVFVRRARPWAQSSIDALKVELIEAQQREAASKP